MIWSAGILLLIAFLYALMSYWTPLAYDDWMFMAVWRDVNGDRPLSLTALYDFWREIRQYDNGRIANTLAPLSSMISPWKELFPVITGILAAGIIAFTSFFSFRKVSAFFLSICWVAVFFLLPWRNSIFVADYSLNYIWAAVITMAFMLYVVKCEKTGWNIYNFLLVLILAFLAGGWHEGFAVSTLAGFFIYTLVKRKFSAQWYITGIFYAAVTIAFYLCPGMLLRTETQLGVKMTGGNLIKLCFDFLPLILLAGLILITALVPSLRRLLRQAWQNCWFVIGLGIVIVGTLLSVLFTHFPRSAFWPDLNAIIMIFILTKPIWEKLAKSAFGSYVALLSIGACLVPMTYALVWQRKLWQESEVILSKMQKSESGTVYHDIIKSSDVPPLTLKLTNFPAWVTDFHYTTLREYYGKPFVAVVPSMLEKAEISKDGIRLEGNANAVKIGDSIILPYKTETPETKEVDLKLMDGSEIAAECLSLPYLSPYGQPLTLLEIYGVPVFEIKGVSGDF